MRVPSGRLKAVLVATFATIILIGVIAPGHTRASDPPGLARFMAAIAHVESHGDYAARNPSGAYGKYQIMPASWRGWAARYLGNANAKPTPANQEIVAVSKFRALYAWLGSWRRVAYWWLTGSSRTYGWSSTATRYVTRVMAAYRDGVGTEVSVAATGKAKATATPRTTATTHATAATHTLRRFAETNGSIVYAGTWRSARYSRYAGGAVTYATSAGATATFRFTGAQGRLVRAGRPDARSGSGPDRRQARHDRRPARLVVHGTQGVVQQDMAHGGIAHPRHRGRRHTRSPVRRHRRARRQQLAVTERASTSISTLKSAARAVTPTVARVGGSVGKYSR